MHINLPSQISILPGQIRILPGQISILPGYSILPGQISILPGQINTGSNFFIHVFPHASVNINYERLANINVFREA